VVKNELQAMYPHLVFQEPSVEEEIVETDLLVPKHSKFSSVEISILHIMKLWVFFHYGVPVFFISIKTNPAKEPPKMNLCSNKCS
jgi:hypothetical protein